MERFSAEDWRVFKSPESRVIELQAGYIIVRFCVEVLPEVYQFILPGYEELI